MSNISIKKLILLIFLFFNLSMFAQKTKIFTFIPDYAINDTNYTKDGINTIRTYETDSTFYDIFLGKEEFFKVIGEKWNIMQNGTWVLFYNGINSFASFNILNIDCYLKFVKTKFFDNDVSIYEIIFIPYNDNQFIIDVPTYYFSPKDGFILFINGDFINVRQDKKELCLKILHDS